jgi:hypothetical protein
MTDSWILKINRAEKHLQDFEHDAGLYIKTHAYRAVRTIDTRCNEHRDCWRYHLEITERPGENLAVVLGDMTHNLRSALDHIAVAITPQRRKYSTFFPIISENIEYGFDVPTEAQLKARGGFDRAVEGMPADAVAIIQRAQPYHLGPQSTKEVHLLGILSRLDNADKHRDLIVLAPGLTNMSVTFSARRFAQKFASRGSEVVEDGAQVAHVTTETLYPPVRESEVNVQIHGTPQVTVEVGLGAADALPADWASELIEEMRRFLQTLDPYVRRPGP